MTEGMHGTGESSDRRDARDRRDSWQKRCTGQERFVTEGMRGTGGIQDKKPCNRIFLRIKSNFIENFSINFLPKKQRFFLLAAFRFIVPSQT